ncbi:hypothetical protein GDO78_011219 [Eleutherodactylus coqui]|uniref:Uncharacterized protein n=1 Tax=Eleutherodactylus coqui TaxID=57060 RepID=A0A8J6F6E6_ELECQ|nr:hypothetical protein GDO78_011219 [Eleutherodactylus coqui]
MMRILIYKDSFLQMSERRTPSLALPIFTVLVQANKATDTNETANSTKQLTFCSIQPCRASSPGPSGAPPLFYRLPTYYSGSIAVSL